ncbi:hypothetical protein H2200_011688 [Cladophialophora chaetospira]|uniref:Glucose-methanol-choline oxidoreductase N-terminal domain-containing protein n=1 Tax=Cladophialophora chaetospira TaxID=386627 RepID=A0AA39CCT2_9EURO|nr:hypothetical protein H2200_011688 [Cladophialophora chaetospira]
MKSSILLWALHLGMLPWAHSLRRRELIDNADGETFDYVVVGCGIAGLVAASRLSEDEDVSVLCLEAGDLDTYEDEIMIPYYIGLQPAGFYAFEFNTVPQDQLDGQSRYIWVGKGVGGGSLINGLIWNRGNQDGYNAWDELGNSGWGWDDLLPYFRKSENYTPRAYGDSEIDPKLQNSSVHGYDGPIHVSYRAFYWPQADNWFDALQELDISLSAEPNEGLEAGGYFLPLHLHPQNQTRGDSRRGYYDPNINRTNFYVQVQSHVTRILFEDGDEGLRASGVEFARDADAAPDRVTARREVILAAGALLTPQLLELSGIGQRSILEPLGIEVRENLPGVGNNLQDHPMFRVSYRYTNESIRDINDFASNATYDELAREEFFASKTGPWTGRPSGAVAFPSLRQVSNNVTSRIAQGRSAVDYLPSAYGDDETLLAGYRAQLNSTLSDLNQSYTPAFEILNDNAGGLHLALVRPLSRGTVHITTDDPFTLPAVDPRWLEHPFDFDTMVLAMQTNQRILNTAAIQPLQPSYDQVPQNADVETLGEILRAGTASQFHYSGTTAMLPRNMGGVVSDRLFVYGTENLRVVDTSIIPILPGAHTAAIAYAAAEKAADLIKNARVEDTTEPGEAGEPGGEDSGSSGTPEEASASVRSLQQLGGGNVVMLVCLALAVGVLSTS